MRLPSLKFLKTFQVAAKLKSFRAAAEELFVTPSAVSHQIKALEEQLGVALFERGVRTLTLTDAGAHYLEHISDIFSKLESVTEQLRVRYGRSIIRLNVPPFFANELLLPRLASFTQAREETDIRIETTFLCSEDAILRKRICRSSSAAGPGKDSPCMSCSRRASSRRVRRTFFSRIPSTAMPI